MNIRSTVVALALGGTAAWAQEPRTGVSHPDADTVVTSQEPSPQAQVPANSAVAAPSSAKAEVYGTYVPYLAGETNASSETVANQNADEQIVTSVTERPGELREGTLLRARMLQALSTETAEPGTDFTASLTEPVLKDGRVVLPAGAILHGRVTAVHGGHRISGAAMLHLEAKSVDLPDGTRFPLHAMLIDTDQTNYAKIDREGSLVRRDHPKEALAAMGLAVGGATTAGAMLGGGVGALVGAGVGAGAGTIVWLKQDRQAVLPNNALMVFSLTSPLPTTPLSAVGANAALNSPDGRVVGDPGTSLR